METQEIKQTITKSQPVKLSNKVDNNVINDDASLLNKITGDKNDVVNLFKTLSIKIDSLSKACNDVSLQKDELTALLGSATNMSGKLDIILNILDNKSGGIKKHKSFEDDNGVEEKFAPIEKQKPIHTWFKDEAKDPDTRAKLFEIITNSNLDEIKKENKDALTNIAKGKNYDDILSGLVYNYIKKDKSLLAQLKQKRAEIDSSKDKSDSHEMNVESDE